MEMEMPNWMNWKTAEMIEGKGREWKVGKW